MILDGIDSKASRGISEKPVVAALEREETHDEDKDDEEDEEGGVRH